MNLSSVPPALSQRQKNKIPWSIHQLLSYLIAIYIILISLISVVPKISYTLRIPFIILFILSLITVLFYGIRLTVSNPTDQEVLSFKSIKQEKVQPIVGKIWCHVCSSPVSNEKSRHCMRCNRCVSNFDHHCKYVNNCVGGKNYRVFVKFIISVQVFIVINIVICSVYFYENTELTYLDCLNILLLLTSLLVFSANGYLIGFHAFLQWKGKSTFEYLEDKVNQSGKIVPDKMNLNKSYDLNKEV